MKSLCRLTVAAVFLFSSFSFSQETANQSIIGKIKEEGFQNSQIMETLIYLTDVYGSRLLGSDQYLNAAKWTKLKLEEWGVDNVRLEPLDGKFRGWEAESFSIEMIEPTYSPIVGWPNAWTASTKGEIIAEPELFNNILHIDSLSNYKGKLHNKVILLDKKYPTEINFEPYTERFTDEELSEAEKATNISEIDNNTHKPKRRPLKERIKDWNDEDQNKKTIADFLKDEGVVAVFEPSYKDLGIISVGGVYLDDVEAVPSFVIAKEQFYKLVRLIHNGVKPKLKFHLNSKFYFNEKNNINIISEIKGADKNLSKEIVLAGGHFDSWHSATGVTDNAANCVVLMEAMRILKKLNLQPKRTIRIGFWNGEEQGYFGSLDYVNKYLGNITDGTVTPENSNYSAYLNLDNGVGKIRGVYLQGNESVRPIFEDLLKPFNYLGVSTLTTLGTFYTDHEVFDAVGIPSFQFMQDGLNYSNITHHSNLDVIENAIEDDLKHNAVIVAYLLYQLAMRDEKLPRKSD